MNRKQTTRPHHIANIAHLFFAEATASQTEESDDPQVRNYVASLAAGEIGKLVCRQLNATSRAEGRSVFWRVTPDGDENFARIAVTKSESQMRPHLILCLMASEIGECEAALKIGRLLGLADPHSLQVLVCPDKIPQPPPNEIWSWPKKERAQAGQGTLLTWCGQLTRSLAGHCPVTVTVMPARDNIADESSTWTPANHIFSDIVRRIAD